jgi:hypothetical protein
MVSDLWETLQKFQKPKRINAKDKINEHETKNTTKNTHLYTGTDVLKEG